MSFASDVNAYTMPSGTAQATAITGRTRLQGLYYVHGNSAGATLTFSDGSSAGATTRYTISSPGASAAEDLTIPDNGILFKEGIHLQNSSTAEITSVTFYYVGGGTS
tara:strand:- start:117 stop:437 length:321 start_codon:yes stop_codon:yes gene_type:complete